jgi:hypothetical protein
VSSPRIVFTRRCREGLTELVGSPAAASCVEAIGRLLADLEEHGYPAAARQVIEREPHVFALPFEAGAMIYELAAEHSREAPFLIAESIERTTTA